MTPITRMGAHAIFRVPIRVTGVIRGKLKHSHRVTMLN